MKKAPRLFFVLILLIPFALFSRSDLKKDWEEADENLQKTMQQMMEMFQKMKGDIRQMTPEFQKMLKDPRYQKRLREYRKEELEGKEPGKWVVMAEHEFLLRAVWNYGSERHDILPPDDPEESPTYWDTHLAMKGEAEFSGTFTKYYRFGPDRPEDYDYDLTGVQEEIKNGKASYSFRQRRESQDTYCEGDQWQPWVKGVSSSGPIDKMYLVNALPGMHIGDQTCGSYTPLPNNLEFPMTEADLDRLLKEGYWQKSYQGLHLLGERPEEFKEWGTFPTEKLILGEFLPNTLYPGVSLSVEIFLEPKIQGPHYIALPMQTSDPQANAQANAITLKVPEIPGWQTSEIKPIGGWQGALKIVAKKDEAGPPAPTLTLAPFAPGKVKFEIEWTSPKGKNGKSKPFEVTVVELAFKKPKPCSGFDEKYEEEHNIPAMSNCVGWTSYTDLTAKPAGVSVKTVLEPADPNAFNVMPATVSAFPERLTLTGARKTKEVVLTARIEIEENKFQKGAEVIVDVLEKRDIKILPINLKTDPLDIWDDVTNEFQKAEAILIQTCIGIEKLPTETVQAADVADYDDGETVLYNGADWPFLEIHAGSNFNQERELTAWFVPHIGTELWNNAQSRSVKLDDPLGFQHKNFIFISEASLWDPNLIAHEIGHYLFGDLYARTEFPGASHTNDKTMVMYATAGSGCEIRRKEWLECLEKCPR